MSSARPTWPSSSARWREAIEHREVQIWPPLPRRTRLRLAASRALTAAGIWLGDHVSWTATERLWRVTRATGKEEGKR